jgi:hypothetical protein
MPDEILRLRMRREKRPEQKDSDKREKTRSRDPL